MEYLTKHAVLSKTNPPKQGSFFRKKDPAPFFIQPKLTINQPNDIYEQEADSMADKVMRMTDHENMSQPFFRPRVSSLQRKCAHCEEEENNLQRKEVNNEKTPQNNGLDSYVSQLNSGGKPLSNEVRNFYEPRFAYDFSDVKIHTDNVAAKSAQSINSLAYTSGNHIVFNNNQYSPGTDSGKKLLAHELTHVVQQQAAKKMLYRKVDEDGFEENPHSEIIAHYSDYETIGADVLESIGYENLIQKSKEHGFLPLQEDIYGQNSGGEAPTIQRQTFAEVYTPFAVAAGIVSQLDSPLPGPGDLVALGILAVGLVAAGVIIATATTRTCPPCPTNPAPEIDIVPPSTPHWPCPGSHWHYRVYNQNPTTCECFLSGRLFGGCCGIPGAPC
ncbi:eCIS core domain-containing protein [Lunatibacter salilacus]|uniref:eCIS core domain-containing protein n=1 Tax=Lunatibacter salilacus TaxID=2483804 RepID=UPI00131EAAF1|nr:DUF4157 domain-containing protein [Lunatibacter salilacus]